jgi:hypothetical protein
MTNEPGKIVYKTKERELIEIIKIMPCPMGRMQVHGPKGMRNGMPVESFPALGIEMKPK